MPNPANPVGSQNMPPLHSLGSPAGHHDGLETPGRFASKCGAPPPISQRHLVNALNNIELQPRPGEKGAYDDIHSQPNSAAFQEPDRAHNIPRNRNDLAVRPASSGANREEEGPAHAAGEEADQSAINQVQKEENHGQREQNAPKKTQAKGKAKAFAFFGQVSPVFACLVK